MIRAKGGAQLELEVPLLGSKEALTLADVAAQADSIRFFRLCRLRDCNRRRKRTGSPTDHSLPKRQVELVLVHA